MDARLRAQQRAAARELARRERLPRAVAALEATLFEPQRAFVFDPAKRIVNWSGRRSGKTRGLLVRGLRAVAAHPGCWVPIIERTTTCQSAQMVWKELLELNERYGLQAKVHNTLLQATFPNRARLQLVGAETVEAADKLRGEHPPEALLDEAGTFRPHVLEYLLREVLEPSLLDHDGTLVMAGTPSARRAGPFAAACTTSDAAWSRHHWTFMDNDALPLDMAGEPAESRRAARASWFDALLERYGWTIDTPWVQREYLGHWVEDTEGLIYRLAAFNHHGVVTPPADGMRYGLGIDFGYDPDPSAFVVIGWMPGRPDVWALESHERKRLIPSALAAEVERLRARFRFDFIVADCGGAGKFPAEEMVQRYGIPVQAARKRGKEAHVAFLNGDLASGNLHLVEATNEALIADLYALRRAEGTAWAEDARDDNHLPDALLYAHHFHRSAQRGFGERVPLEIGSVEWHAARAAEWERAAEEHARNGGPGADEALDGLSDW